MLTDTTKHHILLIGGTGFCRLLFTRAALEAGHTLTLYTRSPSKIPEDLSSNPNLHVIQGELVDEKGLEKAAGCGADTFISLAGPTAAFQYGGLPITKALKILYPLFISGKKIKRVLVLSTPSYSDPSDSRSIRWFLAINLAVKYIPGDAYTEIVGIASETVKLADKIDYTVFRVPGLYGVTLEEGKWEVEGESGVNACFVGDANWRDGFSLYRGRLARWLLAELEERKWVDACPVVSNA